LSGFLDTWEGVAQLVEQRPFKPWVQGSIPCTLTILKPYAPIAQLVEHLTLNQGVVGSIPTGRTELKQ
jgi:hypothetical protein